MRLMAVALLAAGIAFASQSAVSSATVVEIVGTSLASDHDDASLANSLNKLRLTERLTDDTIQFLIGQGIGPRHDMEMILGPRSGAKLKWDHWQMFQGKRTAVFDYAIGAARTTYMVGVCCIPSPTGNQQLEQSVRSPIRGFIYGDPDTGTILRITVQAVGLPADFLAREANTVIDYGIVYIGGRAYILPARAISFIRTDAQKNRNDIEFMNYRKFDTESVLLFTNSNVKYGPLPPKQR